MGTRLTLTTRVREYIDETDADNSHFTDAQIYSFLNLAIRFMGTDLEWPLQKAQATAVEDQAVYTLPEDFISLSDVYFDNQDLVIVDRSDLSAINGNWQDATSGTPRYAYKADNQKIGMFPPPNAEEAGELIQIEYVKLPPDLAADADVPDLHTAFQDCLPFHAAYTCHKSLGNLKTAESYLTDYEFHKKKLLSRLQRFSDELMRFRWSDPRNP